MKYRPGSLITKFGDLAWAIEAEGSVFVDGRILPTKWVENYPFITLRRLMEQQGIRYAVEISKTKLRKKKRAA